MPRITAVLLLIFPLVPLGAQRQSVVVSGATPEGILIQQIRDESDGAKKMALMDEFLTRYPKHEGVPWVYSEITTTCSGMGQYDKAMAAAGKLLELDPGDLGIALAAVKAAEAKKDPDAVRQWAVRASGLARKEAQAPKTEAEDDATFSQRVTFAKQVDAYTEYSLFNTALQTQDPAKKAVLLGTLEKQAPESGYWAQGEGLYFLALAQSGDMPAAVAVAEKVIARGQGTEEMLAAAGEFYLRQNKEPEKVLDYSSKLVALTNSRSRPDGVSEADWQKRKDYFLGMGQWMAGVQLSTQGKFGEADKALRAALPLVEGNDQVKAAALYNLGLANQWLKNLADAIKFYEQCTAIDSPFRPLAAGNLKGLKSGYRVIK
ncbi:MAG: tetratricopeptide repeat protein [Bryobacterales bacterium]|nr:tetratricopeptide repeat protein [Bryobacterales bacterium]